ncbi:hypothetical protein ACT7DH_06500 [Bacillus pacificus]
MSIIIGCAITTLVSLSIVKIMEKHPGYTFTRCTNSLSWEVARKSRNDFLILYAVLAAISLIFSLLYVIHIWILPRTPMFLIMILLSIPALCSHVKAFLL